MRCRCALAMARPHTVWSRDVTFPSFSAPLAPSNERAAYTTCTLPSSLIRAGHARMFFSRAEHAGTECSWYVQ